jgi:RluA family pseudouridine synthase
MSQLPIVKILEDWGDVFAVFKPAGWLTIPGRGNKENVPILSHVVGQQLRGDTVKGKEPDLYVIHRLDEGTSGVMLFARTAQAHRYMSEHFEGREVKKTYWCAVVGKPSQQNIDASLFKLPSKKNKSVVDPKGKPAQTLIQSKATQDGISIVEAQPLTGRSHQIRVHLAHIKCPLLGDRLYGGPTEILGMSFQYPLLHARQIEFLDPSGKPCIATAPLDGDFLKLATALGFALSCSI